MKRLFSILIIGFMLMFIQSAQAFQPEEWMVVSSVQTDSASIATVPGFLYSIWIQTDGTNAVTLSVYDNMEEAGTAVIASWVIPTSASNRNTTVSFNPPIPYNTGLYIVGASAGTYSYYVFMRRQ